MIAFLMNGVNKNLPFMYRHVLDNKTAKHIKCNRFRKDYLFSYIDEVLKAKLLNYSVALV